MHQNQNFNQFIFQNIFPEHRWEGHSPPGPTQLGTLCLASGELQPLILVGRRLICFVLAMTVTVWPDCTNSRGHCTFATVCCCFIASLGQLWRRFNCGSFVTGVSHKSAHFITSQHSKIHKSHSPQGQITKYANTHCFTRYNTSLHVMNK